MKPQVAYRIELSELEKRITKYLRRVNQNDSLELVAKKIDDMGEVMDRLHDLRSRVKNDEFDGFKESARKRLDLDIRKNLVLAGYLRMNKGAGDMDFIKSLIKIDVGLAEHYLFAESFDFGVRAKHSEKQISTKDFNRFDFITDEFFSLFHVLLRFYQGGNVDLEDLKEVLFVYNGMSLCFLRDYGLMKNLDSEEQDEFEFIEFSTAKKYIHEKRGGFLDLIGGRLEDLLQKYL
ncbi:hypothetical protein [Streptococcus sp. NLN64]|uniref:hypothetical protein n=1 Tax=Streptococcus sp. NLN64 TaxID=2822799 RepID=UPI0018CB79DB|nr:hypothetical protein [Streptococcus sp. NLN64]MBG9367558.1 hypothetical protein [Streptococcus sp. NLN64]